MSKPALVMSSKWLKKKALPMAGRICRALLLFGLCFLILQPILSKVSRSFMSEADSMDPTVLNVPRHFTLEVWRSMSINMDYLRNLLRTIAVVGFAALLQAAACTLAGYSFARHHFPLKNVLFFCVIILIVLPPQTLMIPMYLSFRFFDIFGVFKLLTGEPLNMLNKLGSYFLFHASGMGIKSGIFIFIIRQYFRGVPKDLEEAAFVDGCGKFRTFAQIMLPDAVPVITSCFLLSLVWQWTDTSYYSLLLSRNTDELLAGALYRLAHLVETQGGLGSPYWQAQIYTGVLLLTAPLLVVYLFAQKTFTASLAQTGLKM